MGNHQYAIQDFKTANEIQPEYAIPYLHMGTSKLKSRLIREAIEDFNRAINFAEDPAVYDGLGQCHHALQDYEEAIN